MDTAAISSAFCAAAGQLWAVDERFAPAIAGLIADATMGKELSRDSLAAALAANTAHRAAVPVHRRHQGKIVATVPIRGLLLYDLDLQPFATSARKLAADIADLAADPAVDKIVLDVASPGGTVQGIPEAARAIFDARKRKPVVASINPYAGSAAYWLASQSSEIAATPSADLGSIGVFVLHADNSEALRKAGVTVTLIKSKASPFKVEGNSLQPLSAEAQARIQADVDAVNDQFVADVARGRGVSISKVHADFGGGRMLMAQDAVRAGMADRLSTLDAVLTGARDSWPGALGRAAGSGNTLPRAISARRRRLDLLSK